MSIVLIGFMGAGKSTIGAALAQRLNKPFVDLDVFIESKTNMTIREIFEKEGEAYFRALEHEGLKECIDKDIILSTGGGIVDYPNNKKILIENKCNFWVDTNFDTLYNRIVGDLNRPNAVNRTFEDLLILYNSRVSRYNEIAYIRIDTQHSIQTCCNDIINKIITDDNG